MLPGAQALTVRLARCENIYNIYVVQKNGKVGFFHFFCPNSTLSGTREAL